MMGNSLIERLRKHFYKLPEGFYSDDDHGCNVDHPESLLMSILDSGPRGTEVMQELTACGYSIVETDAVVEAADALEALSAECEGLREALKFYADHGSWFGVYTVGPGMVDDWSDPCPEWPDGKPGKRARAALNTPEKPE